MTDFHLLDAITDIESSHLLSAQEKLGYSPTPVKTHHTLRRTLLALAAAIAILATGFVTALAVSEDFRDLLFTFFHIAEPEIIPEQTGKPDEMEVEQDGASIGGVIEATYLHFPGISTARNGIFLLCTDEIVMNSGNHYDAYALLDGEMVKLEKQEFCEDYHILGNDIHLEFEWATFNGEVTFTYVDSEAPFCKQNLAGDVHASLFTLELKLPNGEITSYPVLINVQTGELTDLCAGLGLDALPGIYQAAISKDHSKLLLVTWEKQLYYADLIANKLYNLDQIIGFHVDECSLIGDHLTAWILEDSSYETGDFGGYRAWTIDLSTMEPRELFSGISATASTSFDVWSETYSVMQQAPEVWEDIGREPLKSENKVGLYFIDGFNMTSHWGNMYTGSHFAVLVDSHDAVYVMDLVTKQVSRIDGFLWPEIAYPNIECSPSPDGTKLLIYTRTDKSYFDSVGVLDFEKKSYTAFSRENLDDVREHMIYWGDRGSTIIISARTPEDTRDYYLYTLLD